MVKFHVMCILLETNKQTEYTSENQTFVCKRVLGKMLGARHYRQKLVLTGFLQAPPQSPASLMRRGKRQLSSVVAAQPGCRTVLGWGTLPGW